MAELGKKLGKLSLAILENFVEGVIGEKFVDELRAPTDRELAIAKALGETENLFIAKFDDKELSKALFVDLKQADRPVLKEAVGKYFDHPTDPSLRESLQKILFDEFKSVLSKERIDRAVDFYMKLLTKELMLADDTFRDNIASLAIYEGNLSEQRSVELLEKIAERIVQQQAASQQIFRSLHQLPQAPADFTGREKEMQLLLGKIKTGGIAVTGMQGMGGIGKTVLALKLAEELKSEYPDAQFFLDLRGTDKQNALTPAQAMAYIILSIQPEEKLPDDNQRLEAMFYSALHGMNALFFWDNARNAEQIKPLLDIQNCLTIVTSRQHFSLPGLDTLDLEVMNEKDSRDLIRKIAARINNDDANEIARLCGYLPLAMRLASFLLAERPDITPGTYLTRLKDEQTRLGLIEASLKLSFGLLEERFQNYFIQMGVIASSFSRESIRAVWGTDEDATDQTIGVILKHSLLEFDKETSRYFLHDLVKDFSRNELNKSGNENKTFQNIANWLIDLFSEHFTDSPDVAPHVAIEMDNLRYVVDWAIANKQGETLAALATTTRNWLYNYYRNWDEWLLWLQSADQFGVEDKQLKANVLQAIGDVQQFRDDRDAALASYNEALKLFKEIGAKLGEANVRKAIGDVQQFRKQSDAALESYSEALKLFKDIGAKLGEANVYYSRGRMLVSMGKPKEGQEELQSAMNVYEEIGAISSQANI